MKQSVVTSSTVLLRPREAAEHLRIGLSTFWRRAKEEADFPKLIKLGPRTTCVRSADLEAYIARKAADGRCQL